MINSSILLVLRHSLMVLTEICPKDDQGCFSSNAEQNQNQFTKKEEDSDCYSVIYHEVCVIFISSTWPGIQRQLLLRIQKSKTKRKLRLWTKIAETSKWIRKLSFFYSCTLLNMGLLLFRCFLQVAGSLKQHRLFTITIWQHWVSCWILCFPDWRWQDHQCQYPFTNW